MLIFKRVREEIRLHRLDKKKETGNKGKSGRVMAYELDIIKDRGAEKRQLSSSLCEGLGRWIKVPRKILFGMSLLLITTIVIEGCALTAVTIATVAYLKTRDQQQHTTARGELKAKPDKVYSAMVSVVEKQPGIDIVKKDDANYLVEASIGKKRFNGKAIPLGNGFTHLSVTADEKMALDSMRLICDELGLKMHVVEN